MGMKKISIIIKSTPHSGCLVYDGLRVATALTLYEMDVKIIAIEDGVYAFLKNADIEAYKEFIDYLVESEIKILVDEEDAKKKGFSKNDFINEIIITPHKEIINIISNSDTTITF